MADIPEDHDFFDYGLSSLSVIEIQILVEEALKVAVPTSDLIGNPTIADWISLYTREAAASGRNASDADTTNGSFGSKG